MGRNRLEIRVLALAFLCLCFPESGWATKREELERAAELAVERAAERAAERAVEKALESGNSTTETETIRESYSSVRKSDKTIQLPGSGYTPAQRHEYDRIMREREAGERASALLKRSVDNGGGNGQQQLEVEEKDERRSRKEDQKQRGPEKKLRETASPAVGPFYVTRQLPVPAEGSESPDATSAEDDQQHRQRFPAQAYAPRDGDQFPSLYPVKVFAIQTTKPYPLKLFRFMAAAVAPVADATNANDDEDYPRPIDRVPRVANTPGDYSELQAGRRPGQGWIYR